jgi:predicted acylesterase/phospholipase RssA
VAGGPHAKARKPGRASGRRRRTRVALVCAGGGVTGTLYELGCLRALDELLDRSLLDLDLYVGVSGGALVASLLASGLPPRELYEAATSPGGAQAPLFRLRPMDFLRRTRRAPRVLADAVLTALTGEGRSATDLLLALFELLPAGLLDNSGLQEFLADALRRRGRGDRFDRLERELYIVAVDLDSGEAVAFGEPGRRQAKVSRAVQASTALPGLYRPVRIGGRDFVDGGVKKTAHINLAIRHGADLVICINPIVPLLNTLRGPLDGHLSDRGLAYVMDQVLRIMLHGRMQYGLERYRAEHPEVDILLVEPTRSDLRMFSYNIMRLSARRVVAEHGYRSLLESFRRNRGRYARLLSRHGIRLRDPARAPDTPAALPYRSSVARSLSASLDRLGSRLDRARAR